MKINLSELITDKRTYPNWSTGTTYLLKFEDLGNKILIYYISGKTIMKKRYSKIFNKYIELTPGLCWALGFYKGDGLNSINGYSYHQFSITNKNPKMLNKVIKELDRAKLITRDKYPDRCFQIMNSNGNKKEIVKYWSKHLGFEPDKFLVKRYKHELRKSYFGICHITIGDVFLRRIIDLLNEFIIK